MKLVILRQILSWSAYAEQTVHLVSQGCRHPGSSIHLTQLWMPTEQVSVFELVHGRK